MSREIDVQLQRAHHVHAYTTPDGIKGRFGVGQCALHNVYPGMHAPAQPDVPSSRQCKVGHQQAHDAHTKYLSAKRERGLEEMEYPPVPKGAKRDSFQVSNFGSNSREEHRQQHPHDGH